MHVVSGRVASILVALMTLCVAGFAHAQSFQDASDRFTSPPEPGTAIIGAAIGDFNADGLLDMYHPRRLYQQQPDGTFRDVLREVGILQEGELPQGGVFGDVNADGLLDLFQVNADPAGRTYVNQNGNAFSPAGANLNLGVGGSVVSAHWGDFNTDGRLDLFIMRAGGTAHMFVAQPDGWFSNLAGPAVAGTNPPVCSISVRDVDRDADLDLFVTRCAEDGSFNNLKIKASGSGRFSDWTTGLVQGRSSKSSVWFDAYNDGYDDLYVSNVRNGFAQGNNDFYNVTPAPSSLAVTLQEQAEAAGISGGNNEASHVAIPADFDNDGWTDLFVANTGLPSRLYRNNGDGTFTDVAPSAFPESVEAELVVAGDMNNDGYVDLVLPHVDGTRMWYNTGGQNNWLKISLRAAGGNRFGIGARIEIQTDTGSQYRTISSGSGIASQSDELTAHFGLGAHSEVGTIIVTWPDGGVETYATPVAANQAVRIVRGVGFNAAPSAFSLTTPTSGAFIELTETVINLAWNAPLDAENDPISYDVFISGRSTQFAIRNVDEPLLELNTANLIPNEIYTWTVVATDGHSVRGSQSSLFSFGEPQAPNPTLQPPLLYDYPLPNVQRGFVHMMDLDGDGDLDLHLGGNTGTQYISRVFRLDDSLEPLPGQEDATFVFKTFTPVDMVFLPLAFSVAEWADVDGDGFPDAIVSGLEPESMTPLTNVYLNRQSSVSEMTSANLPGMWNGSIDAGDINGDGLTDVLLTGTTSTHPPYEPKTVIAYNNGNGFDLDENALPGISGGSAELADVDNDGDLDVALSGDSGNGRPLTAIYRNDAGTFVDTGTELPQLLASSLAWGDIDGDGLPDLAVTGGVIGPNLMDGTTALVLNKGAAGFVVDSARLLGVIHGQVEWADYDGDGDLDLLIAGGTSPQGTALLRVFRNADGNLIPELDISATLFGRFAVGDYNGDGDADIALIGGTPQDGSRTRFYMNRQFPERFPE